MIAFCLEYPGVVELLRLWLTVVSAFCAVFRPERPILKRHALTLDRLAYPGSRPVGRRCIRRMLVISAASDADFGRLSDPGPGRFAGRHGRFARGGARDGAQDCETEGVREGVEKGASGGDALHDPHQFLAVERIGGVAGPLQAARGLLGELAPTTPA